METDLWSVVISTTERIDMRTWRKYLASHWDRLMPENTRLLVLAGIHGMKDGRLGGREDRRKDGFVEDSWSLVSSLISPGNFDSINRPVE